MEPDEDTPTGPGTQPSPPMPRKLPGIYTVFEGKKLRGDRQFYARKTGGGNITWATEGFARVGTAHAACKSDWAASCKRVDVDHVLQWPPVPYTKDSLQPGE